ncbi:thymidine phosphorylase [Mycoplasmoides pneumoniae]|uniref:thymidine phosphorylase n=1 Tax=Mycoplasmoides pneumoniae TaxID=2104 RepID=UPI0036F31E03
MNIVNLISKKQRGKALTETEINWFVHSVNNKSLADYQVSAFLMAVWFQGMNSKELFCLTKAMVKSGESLHFNHHSKLSVDKHSTGGIGDKVSIALIPILTALDYSVAKLSGRGLGYTGGTIDKLEAVGVKTDFTPTEAQNLLDQNDCFIIGQSEDIAPVDKVLYALRDTTATVDSLPLIASSVMSKKLAINNDYIFIDLKYGKGAFCKTKTMAKELAQYMYSIAKQFKRKLYIKLSDMNQVLGKTIGNALEVLEVVHFLKRNWTEVGADFIQLMEQIVTEILIETKRAPNKRAAVALYHATLEGEKPWQRFLKFIELQGSSWERFLDLKELFNPQYKAPVLASQSGTLSYTSPVDLAMVSISLGAGRMVKTDLIDPMAGIKLVKQANEVVKAGDTVLELYSSKPITPAHIEAAQHTIIIKQ